MSERTGKSISGVNDSRYQQPLDYYRQLFADLSAPSEENAVGEYQAFFVGPAWLRLLGALSGPFIGLPGWVGKRLFGNGRAINLLKPSLFASASENSQNLKPRCPMEVQEDQSLIDNKPVLSLNYSDPGTPLLLKYFRDELRQWDDSSCLAYAVIRLPFMARLFGPTCLPFVLVRKNSAE